MMMIMMTNVKTKLNDVVCHVNSTSQQQVIIHELVTVTDENFLGN